MTQTSVPERANEITAIPELLDQLAEAGQLKGALVTIDAMGCQYEIADAIVDHGTDISSPSMSSSRMTSPATGCLTAQKTWRLSAASPST
ncbi:hypothetical protein WCLP8_4660018 [uncultured Gammaproteobacteria bacterium]